MAMLSARFASPTAARSAADELIRLGATPDLVIITTESARPRAETDIIDDRRNPAAMPPVDMTRVAIHDDAVDNEQARSVLEAAGGYDIRPIT